MDADNPTADQPIQQKPHRRWLPYLVVLAGIPIFYFVNKVSLAWYYGQGGLLYADNESLINPLLILAEIILLAFILCQSKRRFQFSIRTLLIFVTLFAIACSWFTVKMQQAKRQREAVEEIVFFAGSVAYDYQYDSQLNASGVWCYKLGLEPPGPAWMRNILGDDFFRTVVYAQPKNDKSMLVLKDFRGLRILDLQNSEVTDTGLEHLKGLTQLQTLNLGSNVTDPVLENLEGLIQLQVLYLSGTELTDAGLEHIKSLTQLKKLYLSRTQVSDAGLENLNGLVQLQELDLIGTKVTEAGLEHIKNLTKLQRLDIGFNVTDAALKNLKLLPQLQRLKLFGPKVSDASMEFIKELTKIKELNLVGTKVTDAGLEHLKGLTKLQSLDLRGIKVTDEGVKKLQQTLPNCKIRQL